ncbi:Protein CBR-ORC-2 [Caenorhabditis briggsae]|uniref:Origin recognition complex subunit 2 n=1 Tax=Caenorhabditis briggsae TaxID=6238 RepID=A8WT13_CAEBR|nr:Protein CBR-ORC-2 [Caenorhabditis briggsae]CAP23624.1 Protein CBR-ORC-2 [Caenorhabditis briggsae]
MADFDTNPTSLYSIKGIVILDQDGNRVVAKYYDRNTFGTVKEQKAFEKSLFSKTSRNTSADIVLLDGVTCLYRSNVDLYFYVLGSTRENELFLDATLTCLYDAVSVVLRKNVEKKALVDAMDTVMLIIDEICDEGIIMETDAQAVVQRSALKSDEVSFSDQSVSQLGFSFIESANNNSNGRSSRKSANERMNTAKARRGRRAGNPEEDEEDDDTVSKMITEFTKCDLPSLRDYISDKDSSKFEKQLENLEEKEFPKWMIYLASGFNILLHGIGSKRQILTDFEKELSQYTYLRVDARKDGLNMKALLNAINENMNLNCPVKRSQTTISWARAIKRKMHGQQLILLIDNIEAPDWSISVTKDFRNDQEALCELLENRESVKLIATVDHINSTFIWNSRQVASLFFVHITVNTFEIPLQELMTGDSRLLGLDSRSNQSVHTMSSLDAFWKSLASNSQKLFRLFFQMYFDAKKPVKFWDLFNAAKDDFIASTDSALRTQLVEFKDHRVLKWTRGDDGNDQLSGIVELKLVTEFLESKNMPLDEKRDE